MTFFLIHRRHTPIYCSPIIIAPHTTENIAANKHAGIYFNRSIEFPLDGNFSLIKMWHFFRFHLMMSLRAREEKWKKNTHCMHSTVEKSNLLACIFRATLKRIMSGGAKATGVKGLVEQLTCTFPAINGVILLEACYWWKLTLNERENSSRK